jgi:hypothetical protein
MLISTARPRLVTLYWKYSIITITTAVQVTLQQISFKNFRVDIKHALRLQSKTTPFSETRKDMTIDE